MTEPPALSRLPVGRRLIRALLRRAFRPPRSRPAPTRPVPPGGPAARPEALALRSARGTALAAWLFRPEGPGPAPVVIGLHGWGSDASALAALAAPLRAEGLALLLLDAGGHGASGSEDFMSLPRFADDLACARAALAGRPGVDASRLALIGHSVGAGACLLHAAEAPGVRAVVSLGAFADPREATARWLAARGLRGRLQHRLLQEVEALIGQPMAGFAPLRSAARLRCPLWIVHGRHDRLVPPDDALRLHRAAPGSVLRWVEAGHDLRPALAGEAEALRDFLRTALQAAAPAPAAGASGPGLGPEPGPDRGPGAQAPGPGPVPGPDLPRQREAAGCGSIVA